MQYFILMRFKVRDYTNWRNEFNLQKEWRKSQGEKECETFRDENDPNYVTLLSEWENEQSAKKFIGDSQLSETMQFAGVMDQPILHLLIRD
jgi:quinol monooxygenase YgiN